MQTMIQNTKTKIKYEKLYNDVIAYILYEECLIKKDFETYCRAKICGSVCYPYRDVCKNKENYLFLLEIRSFTKATKLMSKVINSLYLRLLGTNAVYDHEIEKLKLLDKFFKAFLRELRLFLFILKAIYEKKQKLSGAKK